MKLAIIDIDRVIVDCTKRFEQATVDGKIVWERAPSSELLHLDELIPHAVEHLTVIRQHYDQTILLTSRYDHMRDATLDWLSDHGVMMAHVDRAIFKPFADRWTKTKKWKADQVLKILREYSQPNLFSAPQSPITALLIVEDNESNQQEINDALDGNMSVLHLEYSIFCSSLQEAAQKCERGELRDLVDDMPF